MKGLFSKRYIVVLVLFLVFPAFVSQNLFLTYTFTLIVLNIMLAMSFNLLAGNVGFDNLAIGGIAGLGGYSAVYLTMREGIPFEVSIVMGGLFAAGVGLAMVFPSIKVKGLYFAILTLMLQVVLTQLYLYWTSFTNGDVGIPSIPLPSLSLGFSSFVMNGPLYSLFSVGVMIAFFLITWAMERGRRGLVLSSIRGDDDLASHLGINVTRAKALVFLVSSFMAGVAGGMMAFLYGYINPASYDVILTFNALIAVYLGGYGSLLGPFVGASLLTALPNIVLPIYQYRNFISGALFILIIVAFPRGIVRYVEDWFKRGG